MTHEEYLERRLNIAESALRYFVMQIQEQMPPYQADQINRIGKAWDEQLDQLEAEKSGAQVEAQQNGEDKG